jgi:NAD(P)-dependent dehydrogenase (short-subunit alcohol dehydrogenase family)
MSGSDIEFAEQIAVVTGAGRGLGRTYALELARRGAKVVVNDYGGGPDGVGGDTHPAEEVVQEILAVGGEAVASTESIASRDGAHQVIDRAVHAFGRVDILINNAGVLRDRSFLKIEEDDLGATLDVHLVGSLFAAQAAFREMKKNKYGRILFTTSGSGVFGNFGQASYAAAKTALMGVSNVVAIEGARHGITSNLIAPAARTRLTEELLGELTEYLQPELVTPLAIYLVSRECELTHEAFTAGGGWYGRVFTGLTQGWATSSRGSCSVEQIRDNIGHILDADGYSIPTEAVEVFHLIQKSLA